MKHDPTLTVIRNGRSGCPSPYQARARTDPSNNTTSSKAKARRIRRQTACILD